MPEFSSFFNAKMSDRKLSEEEVLQAIRFSISSEYEAIQIYEQIINSTDNKLLKKVMEDIVEEEKVHVGEFLRVLKELYPEEEKFHKQGAEEVEEMIKQKN